MSDKQQSIYFIAITFLFAAGAGLIIFQQFQNYYDQKAQIDLEAASTATPAKKVIKSAQLSTSSSTPDGVNGFSNYQSDQYDFKFSYPPEYCPVDDPAMIENPGVSLLISDKCPFTSKYDSPYVGQGLRVVLAIGKPSKINPSETGDQFIKDFYINTFGSNQTSGFKESRLSYKNVEVVKIAEVPDANHTYIDSCPSVYYFVFDTQLGKAVWLDPFCSSGNSLFDQIFSTFKFTK